MKMMSMENFKKQQRALMMNIAENIVPTYSKYEIFKYLTRQNLWKQFKQWLESAGLTDYWEIPTSFREDDDDFIKGVEAFKARFNWTDDLINTMKEACRI